MSFSVIDSNTRFEKSLGLLTTRFVTLLQESEGGILDLKVVSVLILILEKTFFLNFQNSKLKTCHETYNYQLLYI